MAKGRTKGSGRKALSKGVLATTILATAAGMGSLMMPQGASATTSAYFNDGIDLACLALNDPGGAATVSGTASCASALGAGTASAAGLGAA
ncbi:hypothetical protein [Caballeronia arationis]|uniref:hypothetical protein n=1 Tax=Caballeronia arationis TaxID=1777142 RepID=UPI0035B53969